MIDIPAIAANLTQTENGIWKSRDQREVSYPEDGNEACFAVEDTSFWFRHRNDVIVQLVRAFSPSTIFFDIGGGNGCVSAALQSSGIEVAIVEPGSDGALNAMNRGIHTVIQSTLEDAGFASRSLPSVGLFDVIEHIEDEVRFLATIHRYLQPNGTLYITVPAYRFLWSRDDVLAGHFRRYTTKSLSACLSKVGFEVKYCSYLFAFLVPPIFLFRSVPSLIGLRKSVSDATTKKEHGAATGIVDKIIRKCRSIELNRITNGKRIPLGSSCIAVAKKGNGSRPG